MKKKSRNKSESKGEGDEKIQLWAELSHDLLEEIMRRLSLLSDQIRFRAVCKKWLQTLDQNSNHNIVSLPWLFVIDNFINFIQCSLYEPLSSNRIKPTIVYKINFPCNYHELNISSHKHGWIFTSVGIQDSYIASFLLFSPLTKKQIILPRLDLIHSYRKDQLVTKTFSTKPDSLDCVFLVSYYSYIKNIIVINIFRHGYKQWKIHEFYHDQGFSFSQFGRMPVYIEGIFYFVSSHEKLASYNVARAEWEVEALSLAKILDNFVWNYLELFELNGELMLVAISGYSCCIRMFNRSTKTWVPLKSLGDRSIFISSASISVLTIENGGKSNYGVLPNKIYYHSNWEHSVYSLESGKLDNFSNESEFAKWAEANYLWQDWFNPPDDLLKRKELLRNSLRKLMPEQTMLPVVTKPDMDGTRSGMEEELGDGEMDQTRELSREEDDELQNLMERG